MQIANTQAMNVVLQAIQADTQTSQRLSEEMKKDSLSMKTVRLIQIITAFKQSGFGPVFISTAICPISPVPFGLFSSR